MGARLVCLHTVMLDAQLPERAWLHALLQRNRLGKAFAQRLPAVCDMDVWADLTWTGSAVTLLLWLRVPFLEYLAPFEQCGFGG